MFVCSCVSTMAPPPGSDGPRTPGGLGSAFQASSSPLSGPLGRTRAPRRARKVKTRRCRRARARACVQLLPPACSGSLTQRLQFPVVHTHGYSARALAPPTAALNSDQTRLRRLIENPQRILGRFPAQPPDGLFPPLLIRPGSGRVPGARTDRCSAQTFVDRVAN